MAVPGLHLPGLRAIRAGDAAWESAFNRLPRDPTGLEAGWLREGHTGGWKMHPGGVGVPGGGCVRV